MMEIEKLLESELALVLPSDSEDNGNIFEPDMDTFPEGSGDEVINPPCFFEDQFYKIILIFSINKYQIKAVKKKTSNI